MDWSLAHGLKVAFDFILRGPARETSCTANRVFFENGRFVFYIHFKQVLCQKVLCTVF